MRSAAAPRLTARPPFLMWRHGGPMAEWLRRGLQILARRFDSGSGLHCLSKAEGESTLINVR